MSLKTQVMAAVVTAALIGLGAGASFAATIQGNFNLTGTAFSGPGLVIKTDKTAGSFSYALSVGQSVQFDLFRIWTNDKSVTPARTIASSLLGNFSLSMPNGSSGTVTGASKAAASGFANLFKSASLNWAAPLVLTYGNGGKISVSLSNVTYANGSPVLGTGSSNGADIRATMTLVSDSTLAPTSVPLPTAGFALLAGLGAIGLMGRRRRV